MVVPHRSPELDLEPHACEQMLAAAKVVTDLENEVVSARLERILGKVSDASVGVGDRSAYDAVAMIKPDPQTGGRPAR